VKPWLAFLAAAVLGGLLSASSAGAVPPPGRCDCRSGGDVQGGTANYSTGNFTFVDAGVVWVHTTFASDVPLRLTGSSPVLVAACGSDSVAVSAACSGGDLELRASNGVVQWSILGASGNLTSGPGRSVSTTGNASFGTYDISTNSGTAGSGTGYTTIATGSMSHRVHKITVARTALTAAATTEDETIWTVPPKTRLMRIIVDVGAAFDDAAGPISAVTIMCGTSGGSAVYVATSSVFTVNTIGDVAAEIGTSLTAATVADIPSFSGTQAIVCRFTSTGGNLSTLTTGSATFYIEHLVYP
jgi:hypothetical protein